MKRNTKISIIVPVFNKEDYLTQCIDSILSQDIKEFEIILINDGSTDHSLEILKKYSIKDKRISVIDQENHGVGYSRNVGINHAQGEFICFMDPDDWYPNNGVLSLLYKKAKENNVKICGGSFSSWRNGVLFTDYQGNQAPYRFKYERIYTYAEYQFDYGYHRFIYCTDMIKKNNVFFPEYLRYQDPPFFIQAMIIANQFYAVKEIVYCYREGYQTLNWTYQKSVDLLRGLTDCLRISNENNLALLHYRIYKRINSKRYISIFLAHVSEHFQELLLLLTRAQVYLDTNLLRQYDMTIGDKARVECFDQLLQIFEEQRIKAKSPTASVIIPVYNVQDYLVKCLQSVLNQTYREFEVICVNDGSTDESLNILLKFKEVDNRIKIITKSNGGLSSARNAGVKVARGKYILFLDSDDYLLDNTLERLVEVADKNMLDILYFDADAFYENQKIKKRRRSYTEYYHRIGKYGSVVNGQLMFLCMKEKKEYRSSACLQLLNRSFYLSQNLGFYNGILHEDNLFSIRAILSASRVMHLPEHLYQRRVRENSIMTRQETIENFNGYFITFCEALKFLSGRKYSEAVKNAILDEIRNYQKALERIYAKTPKQKFSEYVKSLDAFQIKCLDIALMMRNVDQDYNTHKQRSKPDAIREHEKQTISEYYQISVYKDQLKAIQSSYSFKIGRFITFIPRKLRGGIRCYREHGITYTLRRIKEKFLGLFGR